MTAKTTSDAFDVDPDRPPTEADQRAAVDLILFRAARMSTEYAGAFLGNRLGNFQPR